MAPRPPSPAARRAPLEPMSLVLMAVVMVHLLVGLVCWTLLPMLPAASLKPVWEHLDLKWGASHRVWFDPAELSLHPDLKVPPPSPKAPVSAAPGSVVVPPVAPTSPVPSPPIAAAPATAVSPPPAPTAAMAPPAPPPQAVPVVTDATPVVPTSPVTTAEAALAPAMSSAHGVPAPESSLLAETSTLKSPASMPTAIPKATSKTITLSPVWDDGEGEGSLNEDLAQRTRTDPTSSVTLLEAQRHEELRERLKAATGGANMDPVLKALEAALKKEWNAPPVQDVPVTQRDSRLRITLDRQGERLEVMMSKPSGSVVLDQSVIDAGMRVKKISESLPSSFPKDRYTVEVTFHIE